MIKKSICILCLGMFVFCACKDGGKTKDGASSGKVLDEDTSYAFGMAIGSPFKDMDMEFDYDALVRGFREYIENKQTKFTIDEAIARVNTVYSEAMETRSQAIKEEQTAYLAENGKKAGVQTTASGLQYEVITEGSGEKPQASDTVRVHYKGTLIDGTAFDSSYDRGEPAQFPLQGVIRGWTEGIQLMSEGSVYRFYIPSELGYGDQGAGAVIPPYATLIFEVELLSIVKL
ncbi:MAG: FKBP-type peptidyl-prolyl cis-trans isomerase [Treponema sp.]|nr:FKBP-type peptidyl-prolyl cis-trans isomerase [Treponema sp.]